MDYSIRPKPSHHLTTPTRLSCIMSLPLICVHSYPTKYCASSHAMLAAGYRRSHRLITLINKIDHRLSLQFNIARLILPLSLDSGVGSAPNAPLFQECLVVCLAHQAMPQCDLADGTKRLKRPRGGRRWPRRGVSQGTSLDRHKRDEHALLQCSISNMAMIQS